MNISEVHIQKRIVALARTTYRGLTEIPQECVQFPVCVGTERGAVGCGHWTELLFSSALWLSC